MIEFIFMLTRDDVTLTDAREVYASVAGTGVRHVGCKDVGLPREELAALMDDIRSHGHETWIEVVSETEEDTLQVRSRGGRDPARPPDRRHADRAGAGDPRRHRREVLAVRRADRRPPVPAARHDRRDRGRHASAPLRWASTGSTCSPTATTATSRRWCARSWARATCRSICAGSVDCVERIRALDARGAWAFTIGTAALDGKLVGGPLEAELEAALEAAGAALVDEPRL